MDFSFVQCYDGALKTNASCLTVACLCRCTALRQRVGNESVAGSPNTRIFVAVWHTIVGFLLAARLQTKAASSLAGSVVFRPWFMATASYQHRNTMQRDLQQLSLLNLRDKAHSTGCQDYAVTRPNEGYKTSQIKPTQD